MTEMSGIPDPAQKMVERIYSAAQPGVVYSAPVVAGSYTVITASEVTAGGGFGFGQGHGPADVGKESTQTSGRVGGGGGGGGGGSLGRPVAVISIGPDGVSVKPVVDPTKIALTAVAALATIAATAIRLRRFRSRR